MEINIRRLAIACADLAIFIGAFLLAFLLRFDFAIPGEYQDMLRQTAPWMLFIYAGGCQLFALYGGIYHFSSFSDLVNITKAVAASGIVSAAAILFVRQGVFPRSILILHPVLTFLGVGAVRFGIRYAKTAFPSVRRGPRGGRRVLLIGAGELGESVLRQIQKMADSPYTVVGFLDEDRTHHGMSIHGVAVLGGLADLAGVLASYEVDEIILTAEAQRGDVLRGLVETMRDHARRPAIKVAPSLQEILRAPQGGLAIRNVRPEDLLSRQVVRLESPRVASLFGRRCVLVTGAGGTIGSELARQSLLYAPRRLVLIDNHATSLFTIESRSREQLPTAEIVPVLADIRNEPSMQALFAAHKPDVVLHAAAHKHVPQLESNAAEGVGNNFLGTYRLARLSREAGVGTFLLISTDKAVRPASVMGATKRLAEMAVSHFAGREGKTRFMTVRFGNVLGSSGSVLEIFQNQISQGKPVTVTHPEAARYFMTVEEAVQLILQAVGVAKGGEIFVLDMGSPVRILDMARNLILLSGLTPDKDVPIQFTGLRAGEKLTEELWEDPAGHEHSGHPDIMVLRRSADRPDADIEAVVKGIEPLIDSGDHAALIALLRRIVPSYEPAGERPHRAQA